MKPIQSLLQELGLPTQDRYDLPTSELRFPDGAHYRVEIPSVEGVRRQLRQCLKPPIRSA